MILKFKAGGWDVLTNQWSLASKRKGVTEVCYLWSGSPALAILHVDLADIQRRIADCRGPICDLTPE